MREKKSEKSPDFRVTAKVGDEWVEIAACWKKSSEKGNYLSMKFGDHVSVDVGEKKPWVPETKKEEEKKAEKDFDALTTAQGSQF